MYTNGDKNYSRTSITIGIVIAMIFITVIYRLLLRTQTAEATIAVHECYYYNFDTTAGAVRFSLKTISNFNPALFFTTRTKYIRNIRYYFISTSAWSVTHVHNIHMDS